ncbi:MAG: serine/threonine-protein kinase [bacterium]|nr:serine/threonine-protein kinase [bacterium]
MTSFFISRKIISCKDENPAAFTDNNIKQNKRSIKSYPLISSEIKKLKILLSSFDIKIKWTNKNRVLGKGSFGEVISANFEVNDYFSPDLAVKILKKNKQNTVERVLQEYDLASSISSKYVVRVLGLSQVITPKNTYFYITQELIPGGDLLNRVEKDHFNMTLELKKKIIYQTILGLEAIHKNNFIHGDLKPSNILLSSTSRNFQEVNIKICDFGFAGKLDFTGCYYNSGYHPYGNNLKGRSTEETIKNITGFSRDAAFGNKCVIYSMMNKDYSKRITLKELKKLKYFKDISNEILQGN